MNGLESSPLLAVIWAGIIAFGIFAYVVMDGFDLGIGILFPTFHHGEERDAAMNSIAPVWDGNETWLVLGGGGLFAAFPAAYAVILPATYPLVIAMLLGLVFRGVAFEFRWRDEAHRPWWDLAFMLGSLLATMAQGMMLGAILQGIAVRDHAFVGGAMDWLSPFSVLTGIALVIGYALLGATWLIGKTQGSGQAHARHMARPLAIALLAAMGAVSAATPFLAYDYWRRWFAMPGVILTAQIPLLCLLASAVLLWALRRGRERLPFAMALALFALGYVGLGISLFPYVVPRGLTLWQAAAPAQSQIFMLWGVAFIVPVILAYTAWSYWVFRGKVGEGYH